MKSRLFKEHAQTEVVTDPQWKGIPGALITVDIADDNTMIGSNQNNDIFVRTGIDGTWAYLLWGGLLKQVSTGGKDKYVGIGMDDRVWSWVKGTWAPLPGISAAWASIGDDGTIWAVTSDGSVFRRSGDKWQQMPGECKQVYVSNAKSIACVNAGGQAWFFEDGKWILVSSSPAFTRIAVGPFRSAIALTAAGECYWKPQIRSADKWQKIEGKLTNVGISKDYIVGTNSAREIDWLDLN
jgi:hypothetical protein